MFTLDVVLHQESGLVATWGAVIGSALVAAATLVGVLVGSSRAAASAGRTANTNARALLDVENTRTESEHRRHLRSLVADASGTARRRSTLIFRSAVLDFRGQRQALWSNDDQERLEQTVSDFSRTAALVRLTTDHPEILAALAGVIAEDDKIRDIYEAHRTRGPLHNEELLAAIKDAANSIDTAADNLVDIAATLLREPALPLGPADTVP